jgi:single-stranded-DNA-specific exonuclease
VATLDSPTTARAWLDRHGGRPVILPHGDADGLSAGVLLSRVAHGGVRHVDTPWTGGLGPREAWVIVDWGVRPVGVGAPVLCVDHHGDPEPVEGVVLRTDDTGHQSTSLLAWRLLGSPPAWAWLGAVGAVRNLGEAALRLPQLSAAHPRTAIRRLATLSSAPGRLRDKLYEPPPESGDYARSHARATGGALTPDAFEAFATAVRAAR